MTNDKKDAGLISPSQSDVAKEQDSLSDGDVFHISWKLRENEATPEEANAFWRHFCQLVDEGRPISTDMLGNLRDALRTHLEEGINLETAFGLTHKRGPHVNEDEAPLIAAEVLRLRIKGDNLEVAAEQVAARFERSESHVRKCWAANKQNALIQLRIERAASHNPPWSEDELKRIREIFKK